VSHWKEAANRRRELRQARDPEQTPRRITKKKDVERPWKLMAKRTGKGPRWLRCLERQKGKPRVVGRYRRKSDAKKAQASQKTKWSLDWYEYWIEGPE